MLASQGSYTGFGSYKLLKPKFMYCVLDYLQWIHSTDVSELYLIKLQFS